MTFYCCSIVSMSLCSIISGHRLKVKNYYFPPPTACAVWRPKEGDFINISLA